MDVEPFNADNAENKLDMKFEYLQIHVHKSSWTVDRILRWRRATSGVVQVMSNRGTTGCVLTTGKATGSLVGNRQPCGQPLSLQDALPGEREAEGVGGSSLLSLALPSGVCSIL